MSIDKIQQVKDHIKKLPSKHLGTIEYAENPTNLNYNAQFINISEREQEYIDSMKKFQTCYDENMPISIPLLPEFINNYINCTVDIKIPRFELYDNENVYQRKVWGCDIYTDDSDVVAILYHCGILKSSDPLADLECLKSDMTATDSTDTDTTTPVYAVQRDSSEEDISDVLVVRLRVLPPLKGYYGGYRNCYNSRSWVCGHDGASVSVESVCWRRKTNREP